jgi:hypothetical protein
MPDMEIKTIKVPDLTPEQVRDRTTQSLQMPMMYFNYVRVAGSFFDIRMFFGQGTVNASGQQAFNEELCVACSVEFARILRDNLTTQIESYEKRFGAIRTPPVVRTPASHTNGKKKHK